MDWHKLQQTLYNIDPTDPREDLAKLQQQAQGGANKSIAESVDYVNQSVDIPEGSLSLDKDYSVSDFAALAGVKITESRQKEGPAGQAKHRDPAPKKLPAGSTKNISRDKLVGDSIEEGPLDSFRQGYQDAGSPDWAEKKLKGLMTPKGTAEKPKAQSKEPPKKKADPQRLSRAFGVSDPAFKTAIQKMNQPGEQNLNMREAQALATAFKNMMNMTPQEIQRNMNIVKTQVSGTESVNREQESIKERLYRELRKKGL